MMKKIYVRPKAVAVNLQFASHLLSGSDIEHLENGTDGDAGAKRYRGIWGDEVLFYEDEDE